MSFTLNTGIAKVCLWAWSYCQWVRGIILYCVTLYPVVLRLIKEIEKRLWHLWHYLLCLVTDFHSSDLPSRWHSHHSLFQSGVKKYLRRVSQEGVSQIVLHIWLHVFCRPAFATFQHVPRGALWTDSRRCGLTIIYLPCLSLLLNMTTFCHSPITCIYII